MRRYDLTKRATSLALATVLLFGAGSSGHGVLIRQHHEHGSGCSVPASGVHARIVDCPCCVHSPPELAVSPTARVFALVEGRIPLMDGKRGLFGPRRQPFELHFPNAPPVLV